MDPCPCFGQGGDRCENGFEIQMLVFVKCNYDLHLRSRGIKKIDKQVNGTGSDQTGLEVGSVWHQF